MSLKTETSYPTNDKEVEEWLKETEALAEQHHKLEQMKDAKALGIPCPNINETTEGE